MSGLQRHSGLVRLSLAVCGRLTLTGLHQPRPQLRWRLSTAVPLGCFALLVLAAVLAPAKGGLSVLDLMLSTVSISFLFQAGFVLATFVTRRDCLRRLNAQLEALERRGGCDALCAGRGVQLQALVIWLSSITLTLEWTVYAITERLPGETISIITTWIPEPLTQPPGSWVMLSFQVLVIFWACCLVATFDSCYFVWMKAASYHLKTIRRTLDESCGDRLKTDAMTETDLKSDSPDGGDVMLTRGVRMSAAGTGPGTLAAGWRLRKVSVQVAENTVTAQDGSATAADTPQHTDSSSVSVATLQEADRYYDGVTRLVSDINDMTSVSSFLNHAATLINVLLDAFLMLRMLLQPTEGKTPLFLTSCVLELFLFVSRLIIYSLSGDEIIRESAALRQALVNVSWQRLTPQAKQHRGELLLKLQQPLCVEPLGFFTVRKGNVLSMTGLFLTHFVIIIQMVQMKEV